MDKIKCFHCKSTSAVKRGFRYNNSGRKQLYLCLRCKRKFTPNSRRMRFDEKEIKKAVSLHRKGMSLSDVQIEMRKRGINVSRWSISLWSRKF